MDKLKEWVKNTILLKPEMKKKLLTIDWNDEIMQLINEIYKKYFSLEKKVLRDLQGKISSLYVEWIKHLENQYKQQEEKEIKKLEQIIEKL